MITFIIMFTCSLRLNLIICFFSNCLCKLDTMLVGYITGKKYFKKFAAYFENSTLSYHWWELEGNRHDNLKTSGFLSIFNNMSSLFHLNIYFLLSIKLLSLNNSLKTKNYNLRSITAFKSTICLMRRMGKIVIHTDSFIYFQPNSRINFTFC